MEAPPTTRHASNGAPPGKNPSWNLDYPTPTPAPERPAASHTTLDPLEARVAKSLGEALRPVVLPEALFTAPGVEATPERVAKLEGAVAAFCRKDPQRAVAAADGEALAQRSHAQLAWMTEERRRAQEELQTVPRRVRRPTIEAPALNRKLVNWPMAVATIAIFVGMVALFGVEMANAVQLAVTASWPFTETTGQAVLFTAGFVACPFMLLWWAEGSAPKRVKKRLVEARRWTSYAVALASLVAFGLAVGLEHGDVVPMLGEPEPWCVPLPLLTVLSVSMLALAMLSCKSAFEACWHRLRGVDWIENPRLEELQTQVRRLDQAIALPAMQMSLAKKLLACLEADLQSHQEVARCRLLTTAEQASEAQRRRDKQRRLRQAQADLDEDAV